MDSDNNQKRYTYEEKPYEKRELDMKFQNIEKMIDINHTETMDKLGEIDRRNHDKQVTMSDTLGQLNVLVTATNGKVKKLEKWQAGLVMSGSVVVVMGMGIIGLVVYIYQYQLTQYVTRVSNQGQTIQTLKTQVQTLQDNQK